MHRPMALGAEMLDSQIKNIFEIYIINIKHKKKKKRLLQYGLQRLAEN